MVRQRKYEIKAVPLPQLTEKQMVFLWLNLCCAVIVQYYKVYLS